MSAFDLSLRLLLALVLGALIGLERQWHHRLAGLRTNALVAIGSAGFVVLGVLTTGESSPTRIAAQVASGIGFLGAGVILREGLSVRGLNTAATLWCSAAVGSLAGMGFGLASALTAAAVVVTNLGLRPMARRLDRRPTTGSELEVEYRIEVTCRASVEEQVRALLIQEVGREPLRFRRVRSEDVADTDKVRIEMVALSDGRNHRAVEEIAGRLGREPGVTAVSWETTEESTDY
jgi:putative Mg2+ transporter-C (MgtC) family protein